jgi:hypothetical protein
MENQKYRSNDIKRICENKLSISFRDGKHYVGWYRLDGKKAARITVAMGKKDIPPKTYRTMAQTLKLNVDEFDLMLGCDIDGDSYREILRNKINDVKKRGNE